MSNIFSYETTAALRLRGCPLCRAMAEDERRWMASFVREGRRTAESRSHFFDAGGFCRRHAWLFRDTAAADGTGAPVVDVYGPLIESDLDWLERIEDGLGRLRIRRSSALGRARRCPACAWLGEARERKARFFVQSLAADDEIRASYASSDGLCFTHLAAAVDQALDEDGDTARFLLEDWRRRLRRLGELLAEYDRKRDYRHANEPKGEEQRSWTEVIRRYVGEDFTRAGR